MAILRLRHAVPTIDLPANGKIAMNSQLEIGTLLEDYLKGLYTGDTALLRTLFHPQATLFGDIRGAPYQNTLDGWLTAIEQRQSPRELGEEFRMETLGIEVINEIAYARCRCPMLGFNYMDYLSLLRQGGRWAITNKLFTHVAEEAT
jgi:hypothetical protein